MELDGIEAFLRRAPTVRDAAVIAPVDSGGRRSIVAFFTADRADPPSAPELRDFLRAELPDYMIPSEFTVLDELPLSPTGKIDREQLSGARAAAHPNAGPLPSVHRTEERLKQIWRKTLRLEAVSADDNFFDLGGSSLQLLEVHDEIVTAFGASISFVDLFECPNIRDLAAKIDGNATTRSPLFTAAERGRLRNAALAQARPRVR